MKKFYLIIFAFIIGCSFFKPFNYSVRFHNEGNNKISVLPFKIALHKKHGEVAIGHMMPGGTKGVSPYYWEPVKYAEIEWQDLLTQKSYHEKVKIQLPKQFTKYRDYPKTIVFILSKDESIKVLFDVWNDKKKDYITVDSEGIEIDNRTSPSSRPEGAGLFHTGAVLSFSDFLPFAKSAYPSGS